MLEHLLLVPSTTLDRRRSTILIPVSSQIEEDAIDLLKHLVEILEADVPRLRWRYDGSYSLVYTPAGRRKWTFPANSDKIHFDSHFLAFEGNGSLQMKNSASSIRSMKSWRPVYFRSKT